MGKLPAIQFYPADWRKDPGVQSLSFHDRGVWFEILCLMHESEQRGTLLLNGKPMPQDALGRLLGLSKASLSKTLATLLDLGVMSQDEATGTFYNRRMTRDEKLRQVRQEVGRLGGNPNLVNQKSTKAEIPPKQKPTPSSSSSVPSSTSVKEERPAKKQRDERIDHPAIAAFREVKGAYPNKDVWDLVIKTVGDAPDIPRMRECWVAWRAKDYKPNNLAWLVDWYVNGIQAHGRNGTGKPSNVDIGMATLNRKQEQEARGNQDA